jgi:hypothetical protein
LCPVSDSVKSGGKTKEFAFLRRSQVMLLLLVLGFHFENPKSLIKAHQTCFSIMIFAKKKARLFKIVFPKPPILPFSTVPDL